MKRRKKENLSPFFPSNCIPHLDNCINHQTSFPTSDFCSFQSILQTTTRRLFLKCRSDHATWLLNLHWLPAAWEL